MAQTPFNFPGGGLVIRFSSPGGAFASDAAGENVLGSRGTSADPSNQFVERFFTDANGAAPWTNASPGEIGGFQLTLADAPQGGGNGNNAAPKKCKKKKHHRSASAAKKKCKKKKHH